MEQTLQPPSWRRFRPLLLTLGVGLSLALLAYILVWSLETRRLQAEFSRAAEDHIVAVRTTLASYLEPLDAIAAFHAATDHFDRQAYRTFVTPQLARRPAISSLEWIPRVSHAQREAYEVAAQRDKFVDFDFVGFQFTERFRQGVMVRASERAEYYPVYYQEPIVEGGIALGFDLGSDPARLEALLQARDTGRMAATARVILVEETHEERYSTLVFRPVYQVGAATATLQERRHNLAGFALVVLRIGVVVAEALAQMTPQGVTLTIYDASAPLGQQFLYHHEPGTSQTAFALGRGPVTAQRTGLHSTVAFDMGGRQWLLVAEPTRAYLIAKWSWYPWLALVSVLTLTAMLMVYLHANITRNAHIALLVAERTAQLRQASDALRTQQQREQALVEAELERVRRQLVDQTRLATLGQVAGTIAHELRNPLGAVRNAVYYLQRYVVKDHAELAEFLRIIDTEVHTSDQIISNLLEMTRAKQPTFETVNLADIAAEMWQRLPQRDNVRCRCVVHPEPFLCHADAAQLRQVLTNLLTNAVQALEGTGEIVISGQRNETWDIIAVQDDGPGISPDVRDRLFEPLFSTKTKGTGLGLTICRQIIEKHGGMLTLMESSRGATFRITLPRQSADSKEV
jgi:signal transduction histidine kinase